MIALKQLVQASLMIPALLISGCSAELSIPQPELPVIPACFVATDSSISVRLEVADGYNQRQAGLMARPALEADTGMLFLYQQPQPADHGFWMYKTLLHLDIAYLDKHGVIGSIKRMAPCSSGNPGNCPTYPAGIEFTQAVEMGKGFFANNHITVGDRLVIGKPCTPRS
ncbi:MAG TPA: DUF192 domain-containing protein [Marinobacter sp.]|nr:DUF192 domain-containing protein [Marinobacter sp.]